MKYIEIDNFADPDLLLKIKNKLLHFYSSKNKIGIFVNKDRIKIYTINGLILLNKVPEILDLYNYTFYKINEKFNNSLTHINELDIAISINILSSNLDDEFRMHFDRNQVTTIIYLSNNKALPLKVFPNVRPDPLIHGKKNFCVSDFTPLLFKPKFNSLISFYGNRSFHGIFYDNTEKTIFDEDLRISIQFAFNTLTNIKFTEEEYYGRR